MADDSNGAPLDDYMSDTFLQIPDPGASKKSKPPRATRWSERSLRTPASSNTRVEQQQPKKSQPIARHQLEKQLRDEALDRPIDSSNVGFRLMAKMGYTQGTALGSSTPTTTATATATATATTATTAAAAADTSSTSSASTPLIEPLRVQMKRGREGIGIEEDALRQQLHHSTKRARLADEFIARQRDQFRVRKLDGQLRAIWRTCQQLEPQPQREEATTTDDNTTVQSSLIDTLCSRILSLVQTQQAINDDADSPDLEPYQICQLGIQVMSVCCQLLDRALTLAHSYSLQTLSLSLSLSHSFSFSLTD
jgi:hypothetical protein